MGLFSAGTRKTTSRGVVTQPLGRRRPAVARSEYAAFFDFDNTVTSFDVLDDLIKRFSINRQWVALEQAWESGTIGSKECLEGQLQSVHVTEAALTRYLATITLDPYFKPLVEWLSRHGIQPIILSDSFSMVIARILEQHGVGQLAVYANDLRLDGNRLIPSFPYLDGCVRCGNCKARYLTAAKAQGQRTIYVGDGLSDVCAAKHADVLFAKASLLEFCQTTGRSCVPFTTLKDVHDYLVTHTL